MNYIIKRSNGKIYASVPNNSVLGPNQPGNSPTPINLVGRDKVGYGQALNENFLWMTEHFSGQTRPNGSVPGQIWYKNTTGTGELLISLVDNARQPDPANPETEQDWAAIPMISVFNTVPDGDNSIMGRMVLTENGDSLKVLMRNKEWRTILTTLPDNKQHNSLLDINYDEGTRYIAFTQQNSTKIIGFFNNGGASVIDADGWVTFQNGEGVLQFGTNYYYEIKIMGRAVNVNEDNTISPLLQVYNTWKIKGSFYVNEKGTIVPGDVPANAIPDPRNIARITQIVDTIEHNDQTWSVNVVRNGLDDTITGATGTTQDDYNNYVTNSLNSTKNLGFRVEASINGLNEGQITYTQWVASVDILAISPFGS